MNKWLYRSFILLILFSGLVLPHIAKASHAAGGEISYEWVSDSTYRIYFKFYRDCTGSAEPSNNSILLCYKNSCNSQGGTVYLNKINKLPDSSANGSPVSTGCPSSGTKCTSSSSIVSGYKEWWYTNTITLPSRCSTWTFSVPIGNRNSSLNLFNAANDVFYVEATLNNVVAQGNSSPFFSVKPVPSVCVNQPYTYNNGAVDPNADSLYFDMMQPLQSNGNCPPTVSVVPFVTTASPSYNITNNPLQTSNSFHLDSLTGQMTFTPTLQGVSTITVRAKEYRNGVLIGSVMRDIQIQVLNCSTAAPIVNTVSNSTTGATYVNGRVEACAGVPMSFCFDLKSPTSTAILVASDNHNAAASGSSVSYVGQKTDSIRGCFFWTPGTLDTGLRVFSVTAKDSTCNSPGVIISQTFVLPIYIWPVTDIIKDTSICLGDSVSLLAVGGSSFAWSVLSGGSPLTSLSCTTCKQPVAKPSLTTQYVVQNSAAQYCSKNKDTATVTVFDYSGSKPTASSNSPICAGDTLKLSASGLSGFTYKWNGPSSFSSTTQNSSIVNAQSTNAGTYYLVGIRNGCFTSKDSLTAVINPIPVTPSPSNNGPLCAGDQLNLSVATVSGGSYSWSGPASFSSTSQSPALANAQSANGGTYSVTVSVSGCTSAAGSTSVTVKPKPSIGTTSFANPTSCGGSQGSISLSGLTASTGYTINYKKNGVSQSPVSVASNSSGIAVLSGLASGGYSQISVTLNGCISDTLAAITLVDPTPPAISFSTSSNPTTCGGTDGSVTIGGLTASTTYTINYTKNSISQTPVSVTSNSSGYAALSNIGAGSYYLTATLNNCISNSIGAISLSDPNPPIITVSNNTPICQGDTIKLIATGPSGTAYTWSGPNSFSSSLQNPVITGSLPSQSGTYSVSGTLNNCTSSTVNTTVTVYATPATPVPSSNSPVCSGDSLHLNLSSVTGASYNWTGPGSFTSALQNPSIPNVDTPLKGIYSVTTTVNGCVSAPGSTTVVIYHRPQIASSTFTNPTTCSGTDGAISLHGLAASTGYTFTYYKNSIVQTPVTLSTNASGDATISGLAAGTYSQFTASANGCASDTIAAITLSDPVLPTISAIATNPTTCLGTNGFITLSGLTNGVTYTIIYSKNSIAQTPLSLTANASGSVVIPNLSSGTYNSIYAQASNCSTNIINSITLVDPTPPTITLASITNPATCQGNQGTITISGLVPGSSCTINYSKGSIGQAPVTQTASSSGTVTLTGLSAGTYNSINIVVNNCTSNSLGNIALSDPLPPAVTLQSFTNPTTCGGTQGTIVLSGLVNGNAYTVNYMKNGVAQASSVLTANASGYITISNLSAGTYDTITATINNCTSNFINNVVLTDPALPVVTASSNSAICQSDTLKLFANSAIGTAYSWSGPNSFASASQNPVVVGALPAQSGTYSVTATINNCTSLPATVTVLVKPTPAMPTAGSNSPICSNNTLLLTAATVTGATYNWTGPGSFSSSLQSPSIANALPVNSGTYTVQATVNGCVSALSSTSVTVYPLPAPVIGTFTISNPTTCSGTDGSITINGLNSNTTYVVNYKKDGNSQSPVSLTTNSTGSLTLLNLSAGGYGSITVTSPNGCSSDPLNTITLTDPVPPSITLAGSTNTTTCGGSQGAMTLGGLMNGLTYTVNYSKNGVPQSSLSLTASSAGQVVISSLTSGTYSAITVTINNCVSNSLGPVSLADPTPPVITASNNTPICEGDTIKLNATGVNGVTYSWTGPGSFTSTAKSVNIINAVPAQSGVYSVAGTLNNCTSLPVNTTVTVKPTPATPVVNNNGPLCAGNTLNLTANNTAGASYSWTGPQSFTSTVQNPIITNANIANAGVYSLAITVNGCVSAVASTTVVVYPIPAAPTVVSPITQCQQDVPKALIANGQNLQWYTVSTGGTPTTSTPIPPTQIVGDTYWYVSQTINGCESPRAIIKVTIKPKPLIPVVATHTYDYCQLDNTVPLSANGTNLKWYIVPNGGIGSANAPIPSSVNAGVFKWYVSQTNDVGCESDRDSITVTIDKIINPVIVSNKDSICENDTISVRDTVTNPPGVVLTWGFNDATVISGDSVGPYRLHWIKEGAKTITLNVKNGACSRSASIAILVKPVPQPSYQLDDNACVGQPIELKAYYISKTDYQWSLDGGVIIDTPLFYTYDVVWSTAGNKTVSLTLTGNNNCVSDPLYHTVDVHDKPEAKIESVRSNDVCSGDTILLAAHAANDYTYSWFDKKAFIENNNERVSAIVVRTDYLYLTVKDSWGCIDTDRVMITAHPCCDIYLPNAFTPNGDGKNDKFHILTTGHHAIRTFMVMNRWGQKVFDTHDENEGWDGKFKGEDLPIGTYYYYIKYLCSDNTLLEKKGEIVLIR